MEARLDKWTRQKGVEEIREVKENQWYKALRATTWILAFILSEIETFEKENDMIWLVKKNQAGWYIKTKLQRKRKRSKNIG